LPYPNGLKLVNGHGIEHGFGLLQTELVPAEHDIHGSLHAMFKPSAACIAAEGCDNVKADLNAGGEREVRVPDTVVAPIV
jgi:hypothetical protein